MVIDNTDFLMRGKPKQKGKKGCPPNGHKIRSQYFHIQFIHINFPAEVAISILFEMGAKQTIGTNPRATDDRPIAAIVTQVPYGVLLWALLKRLKIFD